MIQKDKAAKEQFAFGEKVKTPRAKAPAKVKESKKVSLVNEVWLAS